jgi:hypothetical protein
LGPRRCALLITAAVSCTFVGQLAGQIINVDFSGNISVDPEITGSHRTVWGAVDQMDPWTGRFQDPDTIEGTFSGIDYIGPNGPAYNSWSGHFTATR